MQLERNEIHLWQIDQNSFSLQELESVCLAWLTDNERQKLQRYQFDEHRKQLLSARFLLRNVLSKYQTEISPGRWQFSSNEYGKPEISAAQQRNNLFFNLSHSGDKVVMALAKQPDVGVDIEYSGKSRRVKKIASRYFSSIETSSLLALPKTQWLDRFYDLWTLKEAYIKACGMGLAIPLGDFSYSIEEERLGIDFAESRDDNADSWQFWQLDAGDDYKLSLALNSAVSDDAIEKLEFRELSRPDSSSGSMPKSESELLVRQLDPRVLRSKIR
jgi:4'-phosphopantetheinyl transferase